MWDLDKTTDRNEVWQFITGVIDYLDRSLTMVTANELREIMVARGLKFSLKLLISMVNNGNIACFEAENEKGEKVRYFCSTKFKQALPPVEV